MPGKCDLTKASLSQERVWPRQPGFWACFDNLWLTGLAVPGGDEVGGRKPAWNLENKSPDREWRPGRYRIDPRRLGARIVSRSNFCLRAD